LIEEIMFKNSENDSDIEDGHMQSGRIFREVPLDDFFEQNYEPLLLEEWFYNGEEEEPLSEE
jgi:hypothetical protein